MFHQYKLFAFGSITDYLHFETKSVVKFEVYHGSTTNGLKINPEIKANSVCESSSIVLNDQIFKLYYYLKIRSLNPILTSNNAVCCTVTLGSSKIK